MKEKQLEFFNVLGGRVKMPRGEYNMTSDAVWLAAFAGAGPRFRRGKNWTAAPDWRPCSILDVGIGTGGVSICLLHHNPSAKITGIDINPQTLPENIEFIQADILIWKTKRTFDMVVSNPPYFRGTAAHHGMHHGADLTEWTKACLRRIRPRGYLYMIIDAGRLQEVTRGLDAAGGIEIIPLFGAKNTAERLLISARLGVRSPTIIHAGFSMDNKLILRDGLSLAKLFKQC